MVVDEASARRLIRAQFPGLRPRRLELLGQGWDMTVWLVDGELVFRFPRREVVVAGLRRELEVLPRIAPELPLRVPEPAFVGRPDESYGWPFYGAPLIPGREVGQAGLDQAQRDALAPALAGFLRTLHGIAVDVELPEDPLGRADPRVRAPKARAVLARLGKAGIWGPPGRLQDLLSDAEQMAPSLERVLVHGDLHLRHLLVAGAEATGVIDWIDVCRAPRAADLALYWSLFSVAGRARFLDVYGAVGAEDLLRARVLSLHLCAILAEYAHAEGVPWLLEEAVRGLELTAG